MVRLVRGQVFFDVAHNAARPFRVAAGERVISVLGTRFNIRLSDVETRVLLVEGSIGVSKGDDPANPTTDIELMTPGQQLVVRAGEPDRISGVESGHGLEWRRGFVQFDGEALSAVVAELNRYNEKKLLVRDPKVSALRISGAFPTGDTDSFVQTLTALYPVRVVRSENGLSEIVQRR
jgi:transmembrane sensor